MKYKILEQLGNTGKEGTTYKVKFRGKYYAMKKFKKKKSINKIVKEAQLQHLASLKGIAPKIKECNLDDKYIVMDLLDYNLFALLSKRSGRLSIQKQKEIIQLLKLLDANNIFHGDPNPANFMIKDGKLYIIDFGFSKEINKKLIKKLHTNTPNIDFMILGFILKCKESFSNVNYSHLKKFLSKENLLKFDL